MTVVCKEREYLFPHYCPGFAVLILLPGKISVMVRKIKHVLIEQDECHSHELRGFTYFTSRALFGVRGTWKRHRNLYQGLWFCAYRPQHCLQARNQRLCHKASFLNGFLWSLKQGNSFPTGRWEESTNIFFYPPKSWPIGTFSGHCGSSSDGIAFRSMQKPILFLYLMVITSWYAVENPLERKADMQNKRKPPSWILWN